MKKVIAPRIAEAAAGTRYVFFMDAAHFVFAPFLGYLWSFVRMFIKAPAGRQRLNVLAALNAISHEMVVITNTGYINAYSVCELLIKISQTFSNLPVSIVLDNARYQKCRLVQQTSKLLDIELLYLPAHSPNLNLIERMWKFVKRKCLYSKYYPDFGAFTKTILRCLQKPNDEGRRELASLLTLNFQ